MFQLQIKDFTKQNLADILSTIKLAKKQYLITCQSQFNAIRIRDDDISEYQVLRVINRHKQLILKDQDSLQKIYERKQSRIMINPYESSILELEPQKQEKKLKQEKSQYWKLNESTKDALKLSECKVNMLQQTLTNINKKWQEIKEQNHVLKLQIQSHFVVDALESPTRIKITEHNFKMKPHQSYFKDIQQQKIPQMLKEIPLLETELKQLQNQVKLLDQCDIQKFEIEIKQYKAEIQQLVQVKGYLQQEYNKLKDQNIFMSIQIEDLQQNKEFKEVIRQFRQQKQDQQEKKLVDALNLFISLNPNIRYLKRCTIDEFETIDMPYDDEDQFIRAVQKKYQLKNDKLEHQYKTKKQEYQQKIEQLKNENLILSGQINLKEVNERSDNKKNELKELQEQLQQQIDIEKQANQDLKLVTEKIQWIQKISPIRLKTQ